MLPYSAISDDPCCSLSQGCVQRDMLFDAQKGLTRPRETATSEPFTRRLAALLHLNLQTPRVAFTVFVCEVRERSGGGCLKVKKFLLDKIFGSCLMFNHEFALAGGGFTQGSGHACLFVASSCVGACGLAPHNLHPPRFLKVFFESFCRKLCTRVPPH